MFARGCGATSSPLTRGIRASRPTSRSSYARPGERWSCRCSAEPTKSRCSGWATCTCAEQHARRLLATLEATSSCSTRGRDLELTIRPSARRHRRGQEASALIGVVVALPGELQVARRARAHAVRRRDGTRSRSTSSRSASNASSSASTTARQPGDRNRHLGRPACRRRNTTSKLCEEDTLRSTTAASRSNTASR